MILKRVKGPSRAEGIMVVDGFVGLAAIIVTNIGAVSVAYLRQRKNNRNNVGIKNGRGNLIHQVGKLQDEMVEVREDLAEVKGMLKVFISNTPPAS